MLNSVLILFALAAVAPGLQRLLRHRTGTILAVVPAALFGWFLSGLDDVTRGEAWTQSWAWVEGLGIDLAFRLDPFEARIRLQVLKDRQEILDRDLNIRLDPRTMLLVTTVATRPGR